MEILQAAPHPKRVSGYGKVYQINPNLNSDISGLTISSKIEIGNDPTYRNFFGHPSHKWQISGKNMTIKNGAEYKIAVEINWE